MSLIGARVVCAFFVPPLTVVQAAKDATQQAAISSARIVFAISKLPFDALHPVGRPGRILHSSLTYSWSNCHDDGAACQLCLGNPP